MERDPLIDGIIKVGQSIQNFQAKAIANYMFREIIEDAHSKYNISQEIVTGLAQTYAEVYLSEFDVRAIRVSDDELVLVANEDFVVDFWVSPYGYVPTIDGISDGSKPYENCTYFIKELSRNNLFKYNAAAFGRIFTGLPFFTFQSLIFNGPDYYQSRKSSL